jgi:protein SERAC1
VLSKASATPQLVVQRFGLTEVHSPVPAASALVDLVFVHGLNGDPHNTWTSKESNCFWPRDLLPRYIEEQKVRVLVYGYDADVTAFAGAGVTKDKVHNHAEKLVAALFANRQLCRPRAMDRPIIFVAHSLGGIVVKQALIYSSEITGEHTTHLRSIFVSTFGILFLGTPHKGADIAQWGTYLERVASVVMPKKFMDTSPQLVEALKENSETLQNVDRQFIQLISRFHVYFFHEAKPMDLKGTLRFVGGLLHSVVSDSC